MQLSVMQNILAVRHKHNIPLADRRLQGAALVAVRNKLSFLGGIEFR